MKTLWKQSSELHPTFAPINGCLQEDWFLLPSELKLQRAHAEALREAGIRLPSDLMLSARLTEGDVARISRALGLAVSTNRPGAGFSGQQVDKFFASFRVELTLAPDGGDLDSARGAVAGTQFNPYTKGKGGSKGKKRGHDFTPTEPE